MDNSTQYHNIYQLSHGWPFEKQQSETKNLIGLAYLSQTAQGFNGLKTLHRCQDDLNTLGE